jgi:hypothetical protein
MSSQQVPHARRRDNDAELLQLADDAEIAPARILPSETKDECDDLGIECGATLSGRGNLQ